MVGFAFLDVCHYQDTFITLCAAPAGHAPFFPISWVSTSVRPKQVFLIIYNQSAMFPNVAAMRCSNWTLHCHIIRNFLCKHGFRPAGRKLNRCQKTSTHRDLIRGSRWKSSWQRRYGRCVSSKCATSAKGNRKKYMYINMEGQVATGWKQRNKAGARKQ